MWRKPQLRRPSLPFLQLVTFGRNTLCRTTTPRPPFLLWRPLAKFVVDLQSGIIRVTGAQCIDLDGDQRPTTKNQRLPHDPNPRMDRQRRPLPRPDEAAY